MSLHNCMWTSILCDMERRVKILSVSKNEIIIKQRKTKKNYLVFLCAFVCLFVACFVINNDLLSQLRESMIRVYNPVSSLYNDNSETIFTSGSIYDKDSANVTLPVKSAKYEILSDGTIEFTIGNSIIIMACDGGKIEKIGKTLDGCKYIEILHKSGLTSVISNIEIVGVGEGDIVKSGQDIATAKIGSKVQLSLFLNNVQITNLKISKSKIIWEN